MSRPKDTDRRRSILAEAKLLFAKSGYDAVSMSMLAKNVGIPVGSLYTYFDSKEKLLACIVEEGWGEFVSGVEAGTAQALAGAGDASTPRQKNLLRLAYLIKIALPMLFEDVDLISILLSRAGKSSGLESKFDYLTLMVAEIVEALVKDEAESRKSGSELMRTGLAVMLLGSFEVMRLSRHAGINISAGQVIAFLVGTVENALGCRLPDCGPARANTGSSGQASF